MISYKVVDMLSHLKQYKELFLLLLLLPPCALASAFRRFEANSPPKPATKNLCGCPSLPISHKCGRIWMNPGETRGDACVTDAPSLPCSAVHRASWKLPDREREREGERPSSPRSPHPFPCSIVFLFVRTLLPLGSRSRSLCPSLYYVRFWVDLAKFWMG